jgi:acyl-CoA thioester hydrolase
MAPSFRFFHPLRVRLSEVDPQRIVFNGHYLTYFDVGITEYFRHLGISLSEPSETGSEFYVRKATLEYHAPAQFDDELQIGVRIGRIGNSSLHFQIGIYRDALLLVSGEIIYVNADSTTRQPTPVSAAFRERVEGFEGAFF